MDRKEVFEELLGRVPEDKRDEAYDKLAAVETRAEKLDILESYGVKPEEVFAEGWADEARELSDEELDQVAGGEGDGFWMDTLKSRDCNCEP